MTTKTYFLHKPEGETVCFTDKGDGTALITWQQTLDPNEELNDETMPMKAARILWKEYRAKGYQEATYWHQCKRDWSENRD